MKILLVDDEPGVVDVLEHALESRGHQVLKAHSASVAIRFIDVNPDIDCVVTDLDMEERLSGFKVIEYARSQLTSEIETCLMVASIAPEALRKAKEIGVGILLHKPFDLATFYRSLNV